jgi:hypothetical protein
MIHRRFDARPVAVAPCEPIVIYLLVERQEDAAVMLDESGPKERPIRGEAIEVIL